MRFNKNFKRSTRRNFLRGAAGIAVALPFLESLPNARADGEEAPLRYLTFLHPQGTLIDEWTPAATGSNYELTPLLSPLAAVQDQIVVVSGVDNPASSLFAGSNGHVATGRTVLSCRGPSAQGDDDPFSDGPSIDQTIADRIQAPTPYRSLQFGVGGENVREHLGLYAGPGDPIPLDRDPVELFDRLFSDLDIDAPPTPTAAQRLRNRRGSVLDAVHENFVSLQNKVSAADRIRLEAHAEKVRQLELQVGEVGDATASCAIPQLDVPAGYEFRDSGHDDSSSRLLIDLMVMAIACDLTRVGTLQYTSLQGPQFPWLGAAIPGPYTGWHEMVHEVPNAGDLTPVRTAMSWYMSEYAYLIEQLGSMEDGGDTTILDNMIVCGLSEMGDAAIHLANRLPIVLAGGACGQLERGRHVAADGARLGELYLSFLRMFGVDDATFGEPGLCDGPLSLS